MDLQKDGAMCHVKQRRDNRRLPLPRCQDQVADPAITTGIVISRVRALNRACGHFHEDEPSRAPSPVFRHEEPHQSVVQRDAGLLTFSRPSQLSQPFSEERRLSEDYDQWSGRGWICREQSPDGKNKNDIAPKPRCFNGQIRITEKRPSVSRVDKFRISGAISPTSRDHRDILGTYEKQPDLGVDGYKQPDSIQKPAPLCLRSSRSTSQIGPLEKRDLEGHRPQQIHRPLKGESHHRRDRVSETSSSVCEDLVPQPLETSFKKLRHRHSTKQRSLEGLLRVNSGCHSPDRNSSPGRSKKESCSLPHVLPREPSQTPNPSMLQKISTRPRRIKSSFKLYEGSCWNKGKAHLPREGCIRNDSDPLIRQAFVSGSVLNQSEPQPQQRLAAYPQKHRGYSQESSGDSSESSSQSSSGTQIRHPLPPLSHSPSVFGTISEGRWSSPASEENSKATSPDFQTLSAEDCHWQVRVIPNDVASESSNASTQHCSKERRQVSKMVHFKGGMTIEGCSPM